MTDEIVDNEPVPDLQTGKDPEAQPKAPDDWPRVTPDRKPADPVDDATEGEQP
jgi:hypothetical protein